MKFSGILICVFWVGLSFATPPRLADTRYVGGSAADQAKAEVDTLLLMGAHGEGADHIGTFETPGGSPDWNGWTSIDLTKDTESLWHVDTFKAVSGTYSVWCGSMDVLSCGQPDDPDGGYGHNLNEWLEWRGSVADPNLPCTVTIDGVYNLSTMPGYDYFRVAVELPDQFAVDLLAVDGHFDNQTIDLSTVYEPEDYVGPNSDEVVILFRGTSDGGWDGADCAWPNDGIAQVDDLVITLSNGTGYSHDFEDGTLGDFQVAFPPSVGDYAKLWSNLPDLDPCLSNDSPQVAFIDDGLVVPGTGGSQCIDWCYGPGGYVVNSTGGMTDAYFSSNQRLHNAIESPPMVWGDPDHDGALLSYSVYRHEELTTDAAGIFYTWAVRSVATGDPVDLAGAEWLDRGSVYYRGPNYHREIQDLQDLLVPGRTHVQVQLAAYERGWVWGWVGNNTTPAPYFDNVRLQSFPVSGPSLAAAAADLAGDGFPGSGAVDLINLGTNSVPFDAAGYHSLNQAPLDSVRINCVPLGVGAVLTGSPQLHYRLQRNPVFDTFRISGLPDEGLVPCLPTSAEPGRWAADLPDENFLFPGDRLHYYFAASQDIGGRVTMSFLPADTSGFNNFTDYPIIDGGYSPAFSMRGLPTVNEVAAAPGTYETPNVLLWHDSGTDEDWGHWTSALQMAGLSHGPVDIFHTQSAESGLFNGLGARATSAQLDSYEVIVYTSGEMSSRTIDADYDYPAAQWDVTVLDQWLKLGNKNLLAFGNDLASDLTSSSSAGYNFLADWFGVTVGGRDVAPFIEAQGAPLVTPEVGNPVFTSVGSWLAYGEGCSSAPFNDGYTSPVTDRFDAVIPLVGAMRLAIWTAPDQSPGGYAEAAAVLQTNATYNSRVILIPMNFGLVFTDPDGGTKAGAPDAARVGMLSDVLAYFGHGGDPLEVVPVPGATKFSLAVYPNPFNPSTTISYTVARPGQLVVKVFDLRGQLVRELYNGRAATDGSLVWDGRRDDGEAASSGVYFYEARLGGEVQVGKMALIK